MHLCTAIHRREEPDSRPSTTVPPSSCQSVAGLPSADSRAGLAFMPCKAGLEGCCSYYSSLRGCFRLSCSQEQQRKRSLTRLQTKERCRPRSSSAYSVEVRTLTPNSSPSPMATSLPLVVEMKANRRHSIGYPMS